MELTQCLRSIAPYSLTVYLQAPPSPPSTMTVPCLSQQLQVTDVVSVHNGRTTQKSYLASLGFLAP